MYMYDMYKGALVIYFLFTVARATYFSSDLI